MRTMYDQELKTIQREAFALGNQVSDILADMLTAAGRRDFVAIDRICLEDSDVRRERMRLNDRVIKVVATQNPLAADLRKLFFYTHMADDLLRISSQATGIGNVTMRAKGELALFADIARMGEKAVAMLDGVLSAAAKCDRATIEAVIAMDDDVDVIYEQVSRECVSRMDAKDCEDSEQILNAYKMARRLEIIGDSIVNICRWWLFFCEGQGDEIIV